ncbi:MAG: D-ribitol-5-phosphate cytidylyltransferase [Abditibacteriota bacterium]|nr:D-ribitol-5-phosphate cytidylyltransferase [Abditibacteriota bacterium]
MIFAGILAGGVGSRVKNATMPKQFIPICGKSVFVRCVEAFYKVSQIDKIIVAVNRDYEELYVKLLNDCNLSLDRIILTQGGNDRLTSLINTVRKAKDICSNNSVFLSHDCARCFVSQDIILNNIKEIENYDIVTTVSPVIDTMWSITDKPCVLSKNSIFHGQSPQTFYTNDFLDLIEKSKDLTKYNEAGVLYMDNNKKIGFVEGDRYLFKITNDYDIQLSNFLVENSYIN